MKKTTKWRNKVAPRSISFNSAHNYLCLHNQDSLYPQNLSILKQPEFQCAIRTLTKDMRFLLVMNTQQFFQELKDNKSLSKSLESCLIMFPRRRYSKFHKGQPSERETMQPPDQSYRCYKLLVEAVLLVYYRISKAPSEYKQLVYDEWLLDIPKLLDIAAVYGQSNEPIVKQIIANAYKTNSCYDEDTLSFFNLVQKDKLDQMEQQRGSNISFAPEWLSAKHYANQEQYMVQQTTKLIFTVKDILFNLTNFLKFFPERYVFEFVADFKIQERLVDGITHFMHESSEDWKLGQRAVLFQNHFEDLRQAMAAYFIMEFHLLKHLLSSNQQNIKDLREGAEDTYLTFCLLLSNAHKKTHHQYYQNLINTLIEESDQAIFFPWPQRTKINEKSRRAIEKSMQYEKHYRKHKKKVGQQTTDLEAVFNRYRKNIKRYKQVNQNAPTPLQQKMKEKYEQERRKREMAPDLCLQINSLRYKYSRQYDDDPEEQEQFHRVRLQNDHDYYKKITPKPELDLSFQLNKQNHNHSLQDMSFETINFTTDIDSNQSFSGLHQHDLSLNISSISFVDQGDSLKEQPILNLLQMPELIDTDIKFKKNTNRADWDVDIDLHLENEKEGGDPQEFQQFLQRESYKCSIFDQSNNMSFNLDSD